MQLVPLRARAICNVCDSKLPPRTEAWWDEATRQATCLTCELLLRAERGETAPPPAPAPAPPPPAAAPPALQRRPPVLDVPPPPVPAAPPAPKPLPRTAPAVHHSTPQLPRLVEVTAPRPAQPGPATPPAPALPPAPAARAVPASEPARPAPAAEPAPPAPAAPSTPPAAGAAAPSEPPLARTRGRVPGRPRRSAPAVGPSGLPPRAIPPVPPLPPRDTGPVPPVDGRPDPPEPAAPRLTEVPEPAAARVPEPADRPEEPAQITDSVEPLQVVEPVDSVEPVEVDETVEADGADEAGPTAEPAPLPEQASLHHDLDPSATVHVVDVADGGDGGDLFAPAPIAVPVPNGDRPVDLLAPPRPAPGASTHLVPAELLDRGDMGEGRVGQTLEGGRVHGLEVVHGLRLEPHLHPIGHLVVAVNGLWVVDAVEVLTGKLERRDEGDWFTADPRLHIGGADHTELVASVREKVEAVNRLLARTDFTDVPVRGVLCFGSVQPGWITEPFVLDGVAVTWRRKLVEPMLDPVLIDQNSRSALLNLLVAARVDARAGAARPMGEELEVS